MSSLTRSFLRQCPGYAPEALPRSSRAPEQHELHLPEVIKELSTHRIRHAGRNDVGRRPATRHFLAVFGPGSPRAIAREAAGSGCVSWISSVRGRRHRRFSCVATLRISRPRCYASNTRRNGARTLRWCNIRLGNRTSLFGLLKMKLAGEDEL